MRDFTIAKYKQLCLTLLDAGYRCVTVESYLDRAGKDHAKLAVLRHDVDRKPFNALRMAELENKLGIRSTYYFRYPYTFNPDLIKRVRCLGHEVGYHYEVLSKAKGNYEKAIGLFEHELSEFRKVCPVRTICMHGSPLSRHDNRDLWKGYDFRKFGLTGEAYLSVKGATYFSDTGRTWSQKNKLRDFLPGASRQSAVQVRDTESLVKVIRSGRVNRLYILTHPERWAWSRSEWLLESVMDCAFGAGKRVLMAVARC